MLVQIQEEEASTQPNFPEGTEVLSVAEEEEEQEAHGLPFQIVSYNPEWHQKMEECQAIKNTKKGKQKTKTTSSVSQA